MKRHIKLFALSLIACMIFFATDFSNAQTVSVSNTEFGLNIDSPTLSLHILIHTDPPELSY